MNFNDDGTLASFSVVNDDREFMVVVNFNQNSIDSFALSDLPSKYSSTSIFDGSDDCKLLTLERIEDLVVKKEILKDGNVKISTSNHVVVSEK
ncbi:MAG: hypothetical protein LBH20_00915 [Treponema sp.]|jgi:hypothetical protein|nr:hypothetical protein [Treponema sp.]